MNEINKSRMVCQWVISIFVLLLLALFVGQKYIVWNLFDKPAMEENVNDPEWKEINNAFATNQAATFQAIRNTPMPTFAPPVIYNVEFPSRISGNGETFYGALYFHDPDGDINRIVLDVVSATDIDNIGYDPDPGLMSGNYITGTFEIRVWCEGRQNVTLRAMLYDRSGNKSNQIDFSFVCE